VEARYCRVVVVRPEAPALTVEHYKNLPETGPQYQPIEGGFLRGSCTKSLARKRSLRFSALAGSANKLPEVFQQFSGSTSSLH
jgi:hypothetical protein